jgi:hypothetical protein
MRSRRQSPSVFRDAAEVFVDVRGQAIGDEQLGRHRWCVRQHRRASRELVIGASIFASNCCASAALLAVTARGPLQCATLGLGSATGASRGGLKVNAIATAPTPIADEAMNSQP